MCSADIMKGLIAGVKVENMQKGGNPAVQLNAKARVSAHKLVPELTEV